MVPEDLRDTRRGREVRVLVAVANSSPSEVWVEVWLESMVVLEGSAMKGTGISELVVDSEIGGGAPAEDMVDGLAVSSGCLCGFLKKDLH